MDRARSGLPTWSFAAAWGKGYWSVAEIVYTATISISSSLRERVSFLFCDWRVCVCTECVCQLCGFMSRDGHGEGVERRHLEEGAEGGGGKFLDEARVSRDTKDTIDHSHHQVEGLSLST